MESKQVIAVCGLAKQYPPLCVYKGKPPENTVEAEIFSKWERHCHKLQMDRACEKCQAFRLDWNTP